MPKSGGSAPPCYGLACFSGDRIVAVDDAAYHFRYLYGLRLEGGVGRFELDKYADVGHHEAEVGRLHFDFVEQLDYFVIVGVRYSRRSRTLGDRREVRAPCQVCGAVVCRGRGRNSSKYCWVTLLQSCASLWLSPLSFRIIWGSAKASSSIAKPIARSAAPM